MKDIMAYFGNDDKAIRQAQRYLAKKMFCFDAGDHRRAWCSACGHEVELKKEPQHRGSVRCPHCHERAETYCIWRGYKTCIDEAGVYIFERIDKDTVGARLIDITRAMRGYEATPWAAGTIASYVDSYYIFRYDEGSTRMIYKWGRVDGDNWRKQPYIPKTMGGRLGALDQPLNHKNYMRTSYGMETLRKAARRTKFNRVLGSIPDSVLYGIDTIALMDRIAKHPFATEALAKMGSTTRSILTRYTEDIPVCRVNWRGKTLNAVLGGRLTKADRQWLMESRKGHITGEKICMVWQGMQAGKDYSMNMPELETVIEKFSCCWDVKEIRSISQHAPMRKVIAYIDKQNARQGAEGHVDINLYADYLSQLDELHMPCDKHNLYPKDLRTIHNNLSMQIQVAANRAQERKYQALKRKLERYAYEHDGYAIIVPDKVTDLIAEGEAQHNCVGTYVNRVADGKTVVLFLRAADDHDKRIGTVEVNHGHVVQARGKYNRDLDERAQAFIDKFYREKVERTSA